MINAFNELCVWLYVSSFYEGRRVITLIEEEICFVIIYYYRNSF